MKITIILLLVIGFGIGFSLTVSADAETVSFNTKADKKVEVDLDVTLGRIDLEKKVIDLNIDFNAEGPEFFEFYQKNPDGASSYYNGTKENNAGWYHADPIVEKLKDRTIELDISPSLWPFDSYSAYLYVMFNGELTTEYNLPLGTSMHQDLFRDKDWKVDIHPKEISSRENFPKWVFTDGSVTVMSHKITLSHTDDYIKKNAFYLIITAIVFIIISLYFVLRKQNPALLLTLLIGLLAIIPTFVYQIKQAWPYDLTILEVLLWIALVIHIVFFVGFRRKKNKTIPKQSHNAKNHSSPPASPQGTLPKQTMTKKLEYIKTETRSEVKPALSKEENHNNSLLEKEITVLESKKSALEADRIQLNTQYDESVINEFAYKMTLTDINSRLANIQAEIDEKKLELEY